MYSFHIDARKVMKKKGRKNSWAATAQVLAGGIAKSAQMSTLLTPQQTKKKANFSFPG